MNIPHIFIGFFQGRVIPINAGILASKLAGKAAHAGVTRGNGQAFFRLWKNTDHLAF
jgi:hypothetical protein